MEEVYTVISLVSNQRYTNGFHSTRPTITCIGIDLPDLSDRTDRRLAPFRWYIIGLLILRGKGAGYVVGSVTDAEDPRHRQTSCGTAQLFCAGELEDGIHLSRSRGAASYYGCDGCVLT